MQRSKVTGSEVFRAETDRRACIAVDLRRGVPIAAMGDVDGVSSPPLLLLHDRKVGYFDVPCVGADLSGCWESEAS